MKKTRDYLHVHVALLTFPLSRAAKYYEGEGGRGRGGGGEWGGERGERGRGRGGL